MSEVLLRSIKLSGRGSLTLQEAAMTSHRKSVTIRDEMVNMLLEGAPRSATRLYP